MAPNDEPAAITLDLTGVVCPMNYVRIKLALEDLPSGAILEATLDGGEPMHNVPRSAKGEGHRVLGVEPAGSQFKVRIQKGPVDSTNPGAGT